MKNIKPTILIVEDEPAIAETIQYALETDGFTTHCLPSGRPVMTFLDQEAVDLMILDIGLPDINGLELCKQIRKVHNLPIIFLTARSEEIDRVVGLEIGADDYVVKPFSPRELTARIKAVLRRTRQPATDPPSNQAFQIDAS
ncbi:MAG: response regulator, partial [Desulfobacterales bacterium]